MQFSQSTAEDARDYFSGASGVGSVPPQASLPAGVYRVIDGSLRRVVAGVPPELEAALQRQTPERER